MTRESEQSLLNFCVRQRKQFDVSAWLKVPYSDQSISKINRFLEQNGIDVLTLAGGIEVELKKHAEEALDDYVGNFDSIRLTVEIL